MIFFTSDLHLWHKNIIEYDKLPYADIHEMNNSIRDHWNSVVSNTDVVYNLGDMVVYPNVKDQKIYEFLEGFNGIQYYVPGNHEDHLHVIKSLPNIHVLPDLVEIEEHNQKIILCHYAMRVWNRMHKGVWHLYGHSHGSLMESSISRSFDVGLNCNNYKLLTFDDVKARMDQKIFKPEDHHR